MAQGEHYVRHVEAMTAEALHAKSAIAGELAHRDVEIEGLRRRLLEMEGRHEHGAGEIERLRRALRLLAAYANEIRRRHWSHWSQDEHNSLAACIDEAARVLGPNVI